MIMSRILQGRTFWLIYESCFRFEFTVKLYGLCLRVEYKVDFIG